MCSLTKEQIADIARLLLERTRMRLRPQDVGLEFTQEAVDLVGAAGFRSRVRGQATAQDHPAKSGQRAFPDVAGRLTQSRRFGERIVSSSLPVRETRGRHPLET